MAYSKAEIDRLGSKIREEGVEIREDTLNQLQSFRTSHKDVLSQVFTMLCLNTKKIHPSAIVTYRIKRFESIISKLQRYPEMRFSRMWDIGGCRCILRNYTDVYKLKKFIESETLFKIVKEYDYIKEPQKGGYKSLHLFIKCFNNDKIVEVQLRNQVDHNWATLVEITDVLYDLKLKELGNNKDLLRFHFLLSKVGLLQIEEKKEIALILKKYNYFGRLSEVFSRNYIKVRRQWFEIESQNNHKFFLIETTKDEVPKIDSFKSSVEAEEVYFNVYKSRQNANIVLTHLQTPNYNQVSIAYSNYILTFHSFLTECYEILESLIVEALEKGLYLEYFKVYSLYNNLVVDHIKNLLSEISEVQRYSKQTRNINKKFDRRKEREWIRDIQKQVDKLNERSKRQAIKFTNSMPNGWFGKFIIESLTKLIEKNNKKRLGILHS